MPEIVFDDGNLVAVEVGKSGPVRVWSRNLDNSVDFVGEFSTTKKALQYIREISGNLSSEDYEIVQDGGY